MFRYYILSLFIFIGCVGTESGNPPLVEDSNDGKPKEDDSICPSCISWDAADSGDLIGYDTTVSCSMKPAELTEEIEREFELSELVEFLEEPYTVTGMWVTRQNDEDKPETLPSDKPVSVAFAFELGEFEFFESEQEGHFECRSVFAPVRVDVRVGDGMFNFSANGFIEIVTNGISADLFAAADLASASGNLDLGIDIDDSTLHIGYVEIRGRVYSDQFRGSVTPGIIYFNSQEQMEEWLSLDSWMAYPRRNAPFSFVFPDDTCKDGKLPVESDESLEFLQGKTPNEMLSEARTLVENALVQEARWHNGETTTVTVNSDGIIDATLCVDTNYVINPSDDRSNIMIIIEGWPGAQLKSGDGLIDIPLQMAVTVDEKSTDLYSLSSSIWIDGYMTDGQVISEDGKLEAVLRYDFSGDSVQTDGALYVYDESNKMIEPACLAWPVGGESDELCQSLEPDEDRGFAHSD